MPQPDFTQQFNEIWGWPNEVGGACFPLISAASNVIVGDNPPYSYTDFVTTYPQFAGKQLAFTGTSANSTLLGTVDITSTVSVGMYLTGPGVDSGTTITSLSFGGGVMTIGLSKPVITAQPTGIAFSIINAPTIPTVIVNAYIYLAVNSLYIDRWGAAMWPLAIGLFVAHYVTMWALAQTPSGATMVQVATAGLAIGLDIGQHAGDVSYSTKPLEFAGFGTWQLTIFGQQLATLAQVIGSGGMLLW